MSISNVCDGEYKRLILGCFLTDNCHFALRHMWDPINTLKILSNFVSFHFPFHSRVHVTKATYELIKDSYEVEDGKGVERNNYLRENNIQTYLIKDAKENFKQKRSIKEKRNTQEIRNTGNMRRAVSNACNGGCNDN